MSGLHCQMSDHVSIDGSLAEFLQDSLVLAQCVSVHADIQMLMEEKFASRVYPKVDFTGGRSLNSPTVISIEWLTKIRYQNPTAL